MLLQQLSFRNTTYFTSSINSKKYYIKYNIIVNRQYKFEYIRFVLFTKITPVYPILILTTYIKCQSTPQITTSMNQNSMDKLESDKNMKIKNSKNALRQ